jgi:hypothetical protein
MPADAELRVVGKVRAELQEEQSEVVVHAVDVEVVQPSRGPHLSWIRDSSLFIPPTLGAEHRGLLLRLPNKYNSLGSFELPALLRRDVVLSLALIKLDDSGSSPGAPTLPAPTRMFLLIGSIKAAGGELVSSMKSEEGRAPLFPL